MRIARLCFLGLLWNLISSTGQSGNAYAQGLERPPASVWLAGANIDAGLTNVTFDGYAQSSLLTAAPMVWLSAPLASRVRATTVATGNLGRFASGNTVRAGTIVATVDIAPSPRTYVRWDAEGGIARYRNISSGNYARMAVSLGRMTTMQSVNVEYWATIDRGIAFRPSTIVGYAPGNYPIARLQGGTAISTNRTTWRVSADYVQLHDTTYSDLTTQVTWAPLGRNHVAQVTLSGGHRQGDELAESPVYLFRGRRYRYEIAGTIPVIPHVTLTLASGAAPADRERATIGSQYTLLALRFTLGRASEVAATHHDTSTAAVQPIEQLLTDVGQILGPVERDGFRRLTLTIPDTRQGTRTVDFMGDCTDWAPVPMRRTANGRWSVRVRLSPGSHRVNIRVDGGPWRAPDGLPSITDDFGGTVGILVVP